MNSFSDSLRAWLNPETHCAQRAERAQPTAAPLGGGGSAGCARIAQATSSSEKPTDPLLGLTARGAVEWPNGALDWRDDTRDVFLERLGIADDLEMDTSRGSPAWETAVREARRVAAQVPSSVGHARGGDPLDDVIKAFGGLGGLRFVSAAPQPSPDDDPFVSSLDPAQNTQNAHNLAGSTSPCRIASHRRWWRLSGQQQFTCGACHPPATGLTVERANHIGGAP